MERLDRELEEVRARIADTEQAICRLEREVDAAQLAGLPSHPFEATLRASRSLLGALFARRESLLERIGRAALEQGAR